MENEKLCSLFEEFIKLYKFLNKPIVVKKLADELPEEIHRKIYEISDGEKSTRDVAKEVGTNHVAVQKLWRKWAMSGIVVPAKRSGRYMKAFDLREYGMSVDEESEKE